MFRRPYKIVCTLLLAMFRVLRRPRAAAGSVSNRDP